MTDFVNVLSNTGNRLVDLTTLVSGSSVVSSVFGRTGTIVAQTGDYTAAQTGAVSVVVVGQPNGVASLDSSGKVPSSQLPPGSGITSFAGRTGVVTPQQDDYDSFFLTLAEADARYTQLTSGVNSFNGRTGAVTPQQGDYDGFFLTAAEGDTRYLTQAQADAQGMPAIESVAYSGGSSPPAAISHGAGNITLRTPATPADFWQTRKNTSTSTVIVNPPAGYTISGSNSIDAGSSGLFVKASSVSEFLRWS